MPFTLSHAAAALPLRRLRLIPSALVIGTFAPDLEYFFRMSLGDGYGHTPSGTLVLTVPLALLTLWLFHAFVKRPSVRLLPKGVRQRLGKDLGEFRFGGLARFLLIVASILVGIATHLAWDSFTHRNTWLSRRWPLLQEPIHVAFLGMVPFYKILQDGSTLVGLAAVFWWLLHWYRRTEPTGNASSPAISSQQPLPTIAIVMAIAVTGAAIRAIIVVGIPTNHFVVARFVGLSVVTLIPLVWWQLVLRGLLARRLSDR